MFYFFYSVYSLLRIFHINAQALRHRIYVYRCARSHTNARARERLCTQYIGTRKHIFNANAT